MKRSRNERTLPLQYQITPLPLLVPFLAVAVAASILVHQFRKEVGTASFLDEMQKRSI